MPPGLRCTGKSTSTRSIVIQSILDGVLPKLIPLALTLGLFFLMKKKNWKPVTCIALLLVIGLVGAFFGIFA